MYEYVQYIEGGCYNGNNYCLHSPVIVPKMSQGKIERKKESEKRRRRGRGRDSESEREGERETDKERGK